MIIKQEVQSYLSYCRNQKKLSQKSIKAYSIDLQQFISYFNRAKSNSLTKVVLCSYISELHKFYAPRTAKRKVASLRAFFNYLEFEECIDINPFRKIQTKFQEPKTLPRVIPVHIIEQILSAAHKGHSRAKTQHEKFVTLRNAAIIEMLFATGARVSELCSLKSADINLENGSIRIIGKGKKERTLQIGHADTLTLLRQYYKHRVSEADYCENFFVNRLSSRISEQSVRSLIQNLCSEANILLKITPHMFRHSFATLLLEEDVDIRYIQSMLGHSSIQTTQIYTQVSTEKQRQILTEKHPRNKINIETWS